MKLVDSDIFIDLFRGLNDAKNFFKESGMDIVFSSITEAELLSGNECNDPQKHERALHVLSQFPKIPADNPLVQVAGDIRRVYGLEVPDAIIAASAYVTNSILVTRNVKDFERVKEIKVEKPY